MKRNYARSSGKCYHNLSCGVHSIVHISIFCLAFMRKGPPEISIEWMDVTIDIKVCGSDIPPEDRKFVR